MNSWHIAMNLVRRTLGQKRGIWVYLVIPVATLTILIALIGGGGPEPARIAYVNEDQGSLGGHLVRELERVQGYSLKEIGSEAELKKNQIDQKAAASFVIPANFTEQMLNGQVPSIEAYELNISEASVTLKLRIDSAARQTAQTVRTVIASGVQGEAAVREAVERVAAQAEKHQVQPKVTDFDLYVDPNMSVIIGFTLMFLMGLINTTVSSVMEDRRLRTMARMFAAPVRAFEIAIGNALGSFLVGTLQVLLVLVFTRSIVGFDYHLPFLAHFLIMEFFVLACMGIASAVGGALRNSNAAGMLNGVIITPTCMLGGCFWPISFMPDWMQKIANFMPQKWVIEAIDRLAAGESLTDVWLPFGVLALFAVVLISFGSVILQPNKAEVNTV
ncbi:ABC transporter permease [Cohnella faecalis]|uniref:ABC transporter permease n=1 Tax=Cohnella faecalis TaxID=2315694 RepID=A0A398CBT8_9BACL|nr:ABC transporter permease [Cohnella faecalis]RIE00240.1 ABC transporter permease [Cohnella faecalis]